MIDFRFYRGGPPALDLRPGWAAPMLVAIPTAIPAVWPVHQGQVRDLPAGKSTHVGLTWLAAVRSSGPEGSDGVLVMEAEPSTPNAGCGFSLALRC